MKKMLFAALFLTNTIPEPDGPIVNGHHRPSKVIRIADQK
jgi:hypothetical protein